MSIENSTKRPPSGPRSKGKMTLSWFLILSAAFQIATAGETTMPSPLPPVNRTDADVVQRIKTAHVPRRTNRRHGIA